LEYRIKIASAIEKLSELQQKVVQDLFYTGKSQAQIGAEIGVSQRQISRIKKGVLDSLKRELQGE
ncbi:MAG TPA: sigma factor-like helix-turn-helix DNA-binding protein, partial [Candidatus Bipolaricaulota bacterium]